MQWTKSHTCLEFTYYRFDCLESCAHDILLDLGFYAHGSNVISSLLSDIHIPNMEI